MSADWWQNFANNFAADLAPLLSLFGEQPTKQFLSETLTFVDIAIFSIAPIGVLTAVVSAIRVGGDPSLRAFIGRAQEGGAYAEAELCSSTSRDVCELYTTGGIARVFGRPKILEIVHDPFRDRKPNAAGIYTFEEYSNLDEQTEWTEKKKRHNLDTAAIKDFADHPNLSLNIGIKKLARPWFYLAAAFGLVLQGGVLVFAALATYVYPDIFRRDSTQIAVPAFPFTFAGTILLCTGVGLCATVVESSTKERVFKRNKNSACRLHWVQPGGQIIGDQVFDSFAYSETSNNLLEEYTTSWKRDRQTHIFSKDSSGQSTKKTLLVWAAIITTCVGFVLQFLGIRTLHSSISVAQFVVMLSMSTIRALLRTQRLKKSDNQMGDSYSLYKGHELDWLAIKLACQENDGDDKRWTWQMARPFEGFSYDAVDISQNTPNTSRNHDLSADSAPGFEKAFLKRARLARLTGAPSLNYTPIAHGSWDMTMIASRELASCLAKAIEGAIALFYSECTIESSWKKAKTIRWTIPCGGEVVRERSGSQHDSVTNSGHVRFTLSRQHGSTEGTWKAEKSELEAALGLWLWSVKLKGQVQSSSEQIPEENPIRLLPCSRIILSHEEIISSTEERTHQAEDSVSPVEDSVSPTEDSVSPAEDHIFSFEDDTSSLGDDTSSIDDGTYSLEDDTFSLEDDTPSNEGVSSLVENYTSSDDTSVASSEVSDFVTANPPFPAEYSTPAEANLKLWMGSRRLQLRQTTIRLSTDPFGPSTVVKPLKEYKEENFSEMSPDEHEKQMTRPEPRRIFGYHLLPRSATAGTEVRVLEVPLQGSLEMICAQEIFSAFLMSLSPIVQQINGKTSITKSSDKVHLENQTISNMIRNFVASGIGSEEDALTCIVPVLHEQGKLVHSTVFTESRDAADAYRRRNEWVSAEQVLLCALDLSFQAPESYVIQYGPGKYTKYTKEQNMCLLALCELYRWALLGDRHSRLFGLRGVLSICKTHDFERFSDEVHDYLEVALALSHSFKDDPAIKQSSEAFQAEIAKRTRSPNLRRREWKNLEMYDRMNFPRFLKDKDLGGTLYLLNDKVLNIRRGPPAIALAARNGWVTVLKTLLELGANPEEIDRDGLSYLHHASQCIDDPETFLQLVGNYGYLLNRTDRRQRTPLHLASAGDRWEIAGILMDQFSLDPYQWDLSGRSSFEYAISGNSPKTLAFLVTKVVKRPEPSLKNVMWTTLMQIATQIAASSHQHFLEIFLEYLNKEGSDLANQNIKETLDNLCDTFVTLFQQYSREGFFEFNFLQSTFRDHLSHEKVFCSNVALSCKAEVKNIPMTPFLEDHTKITSLDDTGITCLHYAIKGGNQTRLQELFKSHPHINKLINVNVEDRSGRTPLAYAFGSGNMGLTSLLHEYHAGIDKLPRMFSAIAAYVSGHCRLYFQDIGSRIREMVIRNGEGDQEVELGPDIAVAKQYTPLAVSGKASDHRQTCVYYISQENHLCESVRDDEDWFDGTLSRKKIEVHPLSALAASQTDIGGLRVFYQDTSGDLQEIQTMDGYKWENPKRIRRIPLGTVFTILTTPDDVTRIIFQGEAVPEEISEFRIGSHTGWKEGDFVKILLDQERYKRICSITAPSQPSSKVFWLDDEREMHETTLSGDGLWEDSPGVEISDAVPQFRQFHPEMPYENRIPLAVVGSKPILFYQKYDGSFYGISNYGSSSWKETMVIPAYDS